MSTQNQPAKSASIKRYSFYRKLFFLYALNLCDWLCTSVLLRTGRFFEANPVMSPVMRGFLPALLIKGLLPLALTLLCAVLFKLSGETDSRFTTVLLNIGIIAYTLVNLLHVVNFLLLFFVI